MTKKVYGVGINDANHKTYRCPFYDRWANMLKRCYSSIEQTVHPTYIGCTVCEEWLTFSTFKSWMEMQDWEEKHLDKDILYPGNKTYSPETCVFVDHNINTLLTDSGRARGEWPVGVHFDKSAGRFRAMCCVGNGKRVSLGRHDTPESAHLAYVKFKARRISEIAKDQPERIKAGLLRHAELLELSTNA